MQAQSRISTCVHVQPKTVISVQRTYFRKLNAVACAARGKGGEIQRADGSSGRRRALLDYVHQVESSCVEAFVSSAQPSVVAAMKHTVSNMVGTLPPQHFGVNIETIADTLATLMSTMLRTGYMMRNAQYRLELQAVLRTMQPAGFSDVNTTATTTNLPAIAASPLPLPLPTSPLPALPAPGQSTNAAATANSSGSSSGGSDDSLPLAPSTVQGWVDSCDAHYAPGVQKTKVGGSVMRWHNDHGVEKMPARQYMELLEAEVQALRAQLAQYGGRQPMQTPGPAGACSSSSGGCASTGVHRPTQPMLPAPPTHGTPPDSGSRGTGGQAPSPWNNMSRQFLAGAGGGAAGSPALPIVPTATPWSQSELLDYIRSLEHVQLCELSACEGDTAEAMAAFVGRLMGTRDRLQLRSMTSEFSAVELSKLLLWLLVVGWSLRGLEVRWDLGEGGRTHPPGAPPPPGAAPSSY